MSPENHSEIDNARIVDDYDLYFDAGDALNGSLYLCVARGSAKPVAALSALRKAGLWSPAAEKQVADEQREAYKAGLKFVASARCRVGTEDLVLARFDHPKFPSDATRWSAWLALFDAG